MDRSTFIWLFALLAVVYFLGFPIPIMDVDSAQYASISREMAESGNFLQVMSHGRDYLDKPPLLFWVTAIMFKLFGYANWSFKIGSFLFSLLGVYSTFRLGKLLYSASIGRVAAIVLFSCQGFILFNNDVRTDTILSSSVIFAIWQIMEWLQTYRWKWLIGAAIGIACAMLAKGPIGIMVPVLAAGSWIVGEGRWKDVFRWQYLILLLMVAVLLSPMLYGLYTQFDMQPEKTVGMVSPDGVRKQQNVSGLKFYLWTQSFGRITGENVWKNSTGPLFFVHNFLWSFLPWALVFVMAFFSRVIALFKALFKRKPLPELLTLGGFMLPFIAFSMSAYKLPHYIFVVFPLAAILLSAWWYQEAWPEKKGIKKMVVALQLLVWLAFAAVIGLIHLWIFKGGWIIFGTAITFLGFSLWYLVRANQKVQHIIIAGVLVAVAGNISMNGRFYPELLNYQAGSNAALAVKERNINQASVYLYGYSSFSYYYYRGDFTQSLRLNEMADKLNDGHDFYVIVRGNKVMPLQENFQFEEIHSFGSYQVTKLKMKFLNPETRPETLTQVYLLKMLNIKENSKFATSKTL